MQIVNTIVGLPVFAEVLKSMERTHAQSYTPYRNGTARSGFAAWWLASAPYVHIIDLWIFAFELVRSRRARAPSRARVCLCI